MACEDACSRPGLLTCRSATACLSCSISLFFSTTNSATSRCKPLNFASCSTHCSASTRNKQTAGAAASGASRLDPRGQCMLAFIRRAPWSLPSYHPYPILSKLTCCNAIAPGWRGTCSAPCRPRLPALHPKCGVSACLTPATEHDPDMSPAIRRRRHKEMDMPREAKRATCAPDHHHHHLLLLRTSP